MSAEKRAIKDFKIYKVARELSNMIPSFHTKDAVELIKKIPADKISRIELTDSEIAMVKEWSKTNYLKDIKNKKYSFGYLHGELHEFEI